MILEVALEILELITEVSDMGNCPFKRNIDRFFLFFIYLLISYAKDLRPNYIAENLYVSTLNIFQGTSKSCLHCLAVLSLKCEILWRFDSSNS